MSAWPEPTATPPQETQQMLEDEDLRQTAEELLQNAVTHVNIDVSSPWLDIETPLNIFTSD